jgi:hypothetical protein
MPPIIPDPPINSASAGYVNAAAQIGGLFIRLNDYFNVIFCTSGKSCEDPPAMNE